MATKGLYLLEDELNIFKQNEREEDIPSISKGIGRRLEHRQEKWTTLRPEYRELLGNLGPGINPNMAAAIAPDVTSVMNPGMDPDMTPQLTPEKPAGMKQGMATGIAVDPIPDMTSGITQGSTPGLIPGTRPAMPRGSNPGMPRGLSPGMPQGLSPGMPRGHTRRPAGRIQDINSGKDTARGQATATSHRAIKLVLLGPEGAGKSALGNLLLKQERFRVAATSGHVPQGCQTGRMREDSQELEVVDTPGNLFTSEGYYNNRRESLHEIKEQVKQADVVISVLNPSHKRTPDMGINAFREIYSPELCHKCMLVVTHGNTHYRVKGTEQLLADITESTEVREFLDRIAERVVIVELGAGKQSEDDILDGEAVYGKENEQARCMVMAIVRHIIQNRATVPHMSSQPGTRTPRQKSSYNCTIL